MWLPAFRRNVFFEKSATNCKSKSVSVYSCLPCSAQPHREKGLQEIHAHEHFFLFPGRCRHFIASEFPGIVTRLSPRTRTAGKTHDGRRLLVPNDSKILRLDYASQNTLLAISKKRRQGGKLFFVYIAEINTAGICFGTSVLDIRTTTWRNRVAEENHRLTWTSTGWRSQVESLLQNDNPDLYETSVVNFLGHSAKCWILTVCLPRFFEFIISPYI